MDNQPFLNACTLLWIPQPGNGLDGAVYSESDKMKASIDQQGRMLLQQQIG